MKNSKILKWVLILSIVIVLNLFFNFALKLVYDAPEWESFCPREQVTIQPKTQEECVAQGGAWTELGYPLYEAPPRAAKPLPTGQAGLPIGEEITGTCDPYFSCQKEFDAARELYNRNVFAVLLVLGLASLLVGFGLAMYQPVSVGLSLGGVLSFVVGTVRYWSAMDDYLRVIILGAALATLIWLGIKKLKN